MAAIMLSNRLWAVAKQHAPSAGSHETKSCASHAPIFLEQASQYENLKLRLLS